LASGAQQILDSATGHFRDEFEREKQEFIDDAHDKRTIRTVRVTAAGVESVGTDRARVIVAL
jgi:hypothetical protein